MTRVANDLSNGNGTHYALEGQSCAGTWQNGCLRDGHASMTIDRSWQRIAIMRSRSSAHPAGPSCRCKFAIGLISCTLPARHVDLEHP